MFTIHTVNKDTSIYQFRPDLNAGADPILELHKNAAGAIIPSQSFEFDEWPQSTTSRILIKFHDITYNSGSKYYLMLNLTEAINLSSQEISLELVPLLYDWKEGVGNRNDSPYVTTGTSWNTNGIIDWPDPYYSSADAINFQINFKNDTDLYKIDITSLVEYWSLNANYGLMIKYTDAYEAIDNDSSHLKFFGSNTHTIYDPKIVEFTPNPPSGGSFTTEAYPAYKTDLFLANFKEKHHSGDTIYFEIKTRKQFVRKTYTNTFNELIDVELENCQFQIVDALSGSIIVPFDDINQIQQNTEGYYVSFNSSNFIKNRYYSIIFKIIDESGNSYIKDNSYNFLIE